MFSHSQWSCMRYIADRSAVVRNPSDRCCISIQTFTGTVPFSDKSPTEAMFGIIHGERPPRPTNPIIAEKLWGLMQRCWDHNPQSRPEVSKALEILRIPSASCLFQRLPFAYLEYPILCTSVAAMKEQITQVLATEVRTPQTTSVLSDVPQSMPLPAASPSSPALQELHNLDTSSSNFQDQLCNTLYGKEYMNCVQNLEGDDPTWLVNYLDKVRLRVSFTHSILKPAQTLDILEPSSVASRKCLRELRNLCGKMGILPTSYTLSSHLLDIHPQPFAAGGFGDVYHGTLDGSTVCIKRVRVYIHDDPGKVLKVRC